MLSSLKESAKGSPWSRAKRARTSCRFIIYGSKRFLIGGGGRRGGPSLRREKQRQGSPPTSIVRGSAWQCSLAATSLGIWLCAYTCNIRVADRSVEGQGSESASGRLSARPREHPAEAAALSMRRRMMW